MALGTTAVPRPSLEARAWLRTVGRPGPERWIWPVAALGWVLLVAVPLTEGGGYPVAVGPVHHPGTGAGHADPGLAEGLALPSSAHHLVLWAAMVAATMLPLVAWNLRTVALRSPRQHRRSATLRVAAGWFAMWMAAGVLVTVTATAAGSVVPTWVVVSAVALLAAAWQFTPVKRVAVARCHRTIAPPLGPTAGSVCTRFGVSLGGDCLRACWPAMVLMTAAGHHLLVVLPVAWLSWRDRRRPHDRPGPVLAAAVLLLSGLGALWWA